MLAVWSLDDYLSLYADAVSHGEKDVSSREFANGRCQLLKVGNYFQFRLLKDFNVETFLTLVNIKIVEAHLF